MSFIGLDGVGNQYLLIYLQYVMDKLKKQYDQKPLTVFYPDTL